MSSEPIISWEQADQIIQDQRAEIERLRERETLLLDAGDRLESQLIAVAKQRDSARLTDAERAFLALHAERLVGWSRSSPESARELETVRWMLERHK